MDTMSYSQMMLMVDLISKWEVLAYGIMDMIGGGLDLILKKDSHMGMHIMRQDYFALINFLDYLGCILMVIILSREKMISS